MGLAGLKFAAQKAKKILIVKYFFADCFIKCQVFFAIFSWLISLFLADNYGIVQELTFMSESC